MEHPISRRPGCLARDIGELILPRRCVVCACPLASQPPASLPAGASFLCAPCRAALEPLGGARCRICGRPLVSELETCLRCRERDSALDGALPLFAYAGAGGVLVRAFKFGGMRGIAVLAAELAEASLMTLGAARMQLLPRHRRSARFHRWHPPTSKCPRPNGASIDALPLLVPVPPRPGKLRREGRDQVEDLARALEGRGFIVARVLRRMPGAEQKRLDRAGRLENARRSYVVAEGKAAPPRVILLDDVITTGATLEACAEALKRGGAREVRAFAFATEL